MIPDWILNQENETAVQGTANYWKKWQNLKSIILIIRLCIVREKPVVFKKYTLK